MRTGAAVEERESAGAEQDTSSDEAEESNINQALASDETDRGVPVLQSSSSKK